jgi:uncharacterized protein with HEPN domain
MSKRDNDILINDILDGSRKIFRYTERLSFEEFKADEKTVDAVIRNFEIIGEAANRLSEEFKDQHPDVDWHKIRGFRNRIVHDYAGVDLGIVWKIITDFLPEMTEKIGKL